MRCFPLLLSAALPIACGPVKTLTAPIITERLFNSTSGQLPAPNGTTVYVYEVETNADRYQFQVQVLHNGEEGRTFNFAMSTENGLHGQVSIAAQALDTAHAQLNYFSSASYELEEAASVWWSKTIYNEIMAKGASYIAMKKPDVLDYGMLNADGTAQIRRIDSLPAITNGKNFLCEYNGDAVAIEAIFAEGSWKGQPVQYAVLRDSAFPLILYMDIGFRIRLRQIWQLDEMHDPLALKTGSVLKYVYMHLDSVAHETYDYVDDTLLIRLNRFDAAGTAGVWALYRNTPEQAMAKGTCLSLFSQGTADFAFWSDPQNYCSAKPAAFNGHCQGWWFSNPLLESLFMPGNLAGFHFNGFSRYETWQIKADESGMFPRRIEISVNGADIPCFAHRIVPAGNMSEAFMEFLPCKANPILLRWDAGGYQGLWLHAVSNP
ncbi:MAG: hypothetical protein ACOVSS_08745 [Bacteroidia bacterium]